MTATRALLLDTSTRGRLLTATLLDDGGWRVDFASYSPAAALEWRGYATVRAVSVLQRNGVL